MAQYIKLGPLNASDFETPIEFTSAVTVPDATADGHAINKGQADAAYAPINQYGIPIPVTADWATGTNMRDDIQNVLGIVAGQVVRGVVFAANFSDFSADMQIYDDGTGVTIGCSYTFGTFPAAGMVYLHIRELSDI